MARHCKRPLGRKLPTGGAPSLPRGWAGYAVARPDVVPRVEVARHGNYRHGGRSKSGIEGMRMVRLYGRILRAALRPAGSIPTVPPEVFARPAGWRGWPGAEANAGG
jgi:hypothetical protein